MHAKQQRIIFHMGNIVSVLLLPAIPILMAWFVASCLLYSQLIGHPEARIAEETRWAGYRFYGVLGLVCIIALSPLNKVLPILHFCVIAWFLAIVIVVPCSIRDIYRLAHARSAAFA